ncbi:hypothetical protein E2C01_071439 [Portunus trituberculatus]|uniref:Uncharacterized protein n=1 Tax=Portunus trituberculatus TaxID=210409 RepID=A0A5B7HZZ3_PORTR|nr:hypothetical protein [Portunus trituberculatus]
MRISSCAFLTHKYEVSCVQVHTLLHISILPLLMIRPTPQYCLTPGPRAGKFPDIDKETRRSDEEEYDGLLRGGKK